jgi:exodeoxyribonuclease-3
VGGRVPRLHQEAGRKKAVILCGDLNVAHQRSSEKSLPPTGRLPDSPTKNGEIFRAADALCRPYRFLYPDVTGVYTWWSTFNARANKAGWRIDYFWFQTDQGQDQQCGHL